MTVRGLLIAPLLFAVAFPMATALAAETAIEIDGKTYHLDIPDDFKLRDKLPGGADFGERLRYEATYSDPDFRMMFLDFSHSPQSTYDSNVGQKSNRNLDRKTLPNNVVVVVPTDPSYRSFTIMKDFGCGAHCVLAISVASVPLHPRMDELADEFAKQLSNYKD